VNVPQLLAGGAADFGMGSNSFISLNMVKTGVPIRAVMAIFQKDPQVLISHPRRDINSLADMRGQAGTDFGGDHECLLALAKASRRQRQADPSLYLQIWRPSSGPQCHPGGLSHQRAFHHSEPRRTFTPKFSCSADYGYPATPYGAPVPQKWIDTNRKAVQLFVDATAMAAALSAESGKGKRADQRGNPDISDAVLNQALDDEAL